MIVGFYVIGDVVVLVVVVVFEWVVVDFGVVVVVCCGYCFEYVEMVIVD